MKKFLLFVATVFAAAGAFAQFGTAPDFSVTDIDGNTHNLYADILDQGLIAVVDVSATWCGPCWSLHQSHALEDLHQAYGPNGTNQLRVIFYEGDASTGLDAIMGTGGNTIGDWTNGSTYPIVNESPLSLDLNIWAPLGFPTVNVIRPSDYEIVLDTYNIYSGEGQVDAINGADIDGIVLDPQVILSVDESVSAASINVFPNPTAGQLNIQLEGFNGQTTVEVLSIVGEVVAQTSTANAFETIDLSELAAGNYIVRVSNDEAEAIRRVAVTK